jgi:hypothetical protein
MSGNNGCPNDENDYEVGVREERARIVAWLRSYDDTHRRSTLAERIEKGEHEQHEVPNERKSRLIQA